MIESFPIQPSSSVTSTKYCPLKSDVTLSPFTIFMSGNNQLKSYGSIPPVAVASIVIGPSTRHCSTTGASISTGKVEYTSITILAVPKQPTSSLTVTTYWVPLTGLGIVIDGV